MPAWLEAVKGLPKARQAELMHMYREELRIFVRDLMTDANSKEVLYLRDLALYGRRGGPSFQKLVDSAMDVHQDIDRAYDGIIESSQRSNKDVNRTITGNDSGIDAANEKRSTE